MLLLALACAGCGGGGGGGGGGATDHSSKDDRIESFDAGRQPAVLLGAGPLGHKVVVYMHGAGETIQTAFRDPAKRELFRTLLNAGYALAATDAHGDNWGSPASVRDQLALVDELRSRGLRDVYVIALSMGGLDGLQVLDRIPVKAFAGIFPACDLGSVWDVGIYRGQIRAAYGLSAGASPSAVLRPRSPVAIHPAVGLPMRFWASPGDRVIPARENTEACAAIARRRGAQVEVTTTRGDHGDPSNYDPAGIVRLFASAP